MNHKFAFPIFKSVVYFGPSSHLTFDLNQMDSSHEFRLTFMLRKKERERNPFLNSLVPTNPCFHLYLPGETE